MTYLPGRSAAAAMLPAAIGMRMFWGLAVDYPFAMNASWICPLLGAVIFLPFGIMLNQASKMGNGSIWDNLTGGTASIWKRAVAMLFALILLYDASVSVRQTASSSNLIALNDITVHLLILPLSIVVAAVVLLGGDAAGNSARIWLKILPLFALIMLAVQLKGYRIGWLTPILGGGVNSIINGGIYCAGCLAMASLAWVIALPDRCRKDILLYTMLPSAVVSLLMVTQHMSFPAMINIPFTRAARIELILSNGRMSLSPQLILDVLWFGSLLHMISVEVVTAASFLHIAACKAPKWLLAAMISAAVTLVAIFNPDWLKRSAELTRLLFVGIGGIIVIFSLSAHVRKVAEEHDKA